MNLRLMCIACIVGVALTAIAVDATRTGWASWLPGSMIRHRDAVAVAISTVAIGQNDGVAHKAIVDALITEGLDIRSPNYLRAMINGTFDKALAKALQVSNPEAAGLYYPFEERGMAPLYTAAFRMFGINAASWFWLYVTLAGVSAVAAIISFRNDGAALFMVAAATIAHAAVAVLLPNTPQDDVNILTSNRFLGILGTLPALHLMLAMRLQAPSAISILTAAVQVAILCVILNARVTSAWLLIAIAAFAVLNFRRTSRLPIALIGAGLAAMFFINHVSENAAYRDGRAQSGHVFWHNFLTAIHNNPDRSRFSIPSTIPAYDDLIAFIQFERALTQKQLDRSSFLLNRPDWHYRTTEPKYDLRWKEYDSFMRGVAIDTMAAEPVYVASSLLWHQPVLAARELLGPSFLMNPALYNPLWLALIVAALACARPTTAHMLIPACLIIGAAAPSLASGVAPFRLVELFYALLFGGVVALVGVFPAINTARKARYRRSCQSPRNYRE